LGILTIGTIGLFLFIFSGILTIGTIGLFD
jgi:hypothetical protein